MNVLFITSWYPGPSNPVNGVFVREHAKAVSLYDEVSVLHLAGRQLSIKSWWRVGKEEDPGYSEGIPTYRVWHRISPLPKTSFLIHLWSVFKAYSYLMSIGVKPDILHAHTYSAGISTFLLARLYDIPLVITEHSTAFPRKLLNGLQVYLARLAFRHAKFVLPVSKSLQKAIQDYGIEARFSVVPNVVDPAIFFPASFSHDENCRRLLFTGLLDDSPVKGIYHLLKALAKLKSIRSDWRLDLAGGGPGLAGFQRLAFELDLQDHLTFHGLLPKREVARLMNQADFFVLPSLWENLPCVLIEAMACGLPIVATRTGGIPEIIDEETGILVPPGDENALFLALNEMIDNLEAYDRQAIVAKARAYHPERVGEMLHAIYQETLSS